MCQAAFSAGHPAKRLLSEVRVLGSKVQALDISWQCRLLGSPVSESGSSSPFEGEPPPMPNCPLWHPLPFPAGISISLEEPRASSPLPKSNYLHWISAGTNIFLVLGGGKDSEKLLLMVSFEKKPCQTYALPGLVIGEGRRRRIESL